MNTETFPRLGKDGHGEKPTLASRLTEVLRRDILNGTIRRGDQLPTQADLMERYGVSRTVVRESAAVLQADGLVEIRHGIGVFVTSDQMPRRGFEPVDVSRVAAVIDVLELRAAVESEAAALAAERRTKEQNEQIKRSLGKLITRSSGGNDDAGADFDLHLAIANATNNGRFVEFLRMLGRSAIPRAAMQSDGGWGVDAAYLEMINAEHKRIVDSISAQNVKGARQAMRDHLRRSGDRYRRLVDSARR